MAQLFTLGDFAQTMTTTEPHERLLSVLREARAFLSRSGNDFAWSKWDDAADALREFDGLISRVERGDIPGRFELDILFAPTGAIQEVSLSSGWGDEFCDLAARFDEVIKRL